MYPSYLPIPKKNVSVANYQLCVQYSSSVPDAQAAKFLANLASEDPLHGWDITTDGEDNS